MVRNPRKPTEDELELIALCLTQGYTGLIIKFINSNELDSEYHIRQVLKRSVKYCIFEFNNQRSLDSIDMVNETITKIIKWYRNKV